MNSKLQKEDGPSAIQPDAMERIGQMVGFGLLGGIAAGLLVGGIGGRLIMRVLAMVNEAGVITDNGNISGEITVGGTFRLIIIVGLGTGVIGGFGYVMIRRWLPGRGLLKGVAFGLVLLCFSGTNHPILKPLFNGENADFELFDPRQLSVGLFALLFLLYGVVLSLIVERHDRYVPPLFTRPLITALGYLLVAGLCAYGLYRTVPAVNAIL